MQLTLQSLIPIPLRENVIARNSGIWNQTKKFNGGEYVFIQAPSGSGKTTLMHILYGLRTDFEGAVAWDENSVNTIQTDGLANLRAKSISIIFQDLRIFPELTAYENIEIKRTLTNTVGSEIIIEWLGRLGIAHKKDSMGKTLSFGEQQRVAIIRALVQPFDWLLMDEPFSHLDHDNIQKACGLIKEVLNKCGAGFILADLEENCYFPYTEKLKL